MQGQKVTYQLLLERVLWLIPQNNSHMIRFPMGIQSSNNRLGQIRCRCRLTGGSRRAYLMAIVPVHAFMTTLRWWTLGRIFLRDCDLLCKVTSEFCMTPLLPFSFYSRWLILVSSMSIQSGRMALTMTWRSWCTSGSMAAGQSAV